MRLLHPLSLSETQAHRLGNHRFIPSGEPYCGDDARLFDTFELKHLTIENTERH